MNASNLQVEFTISGNLCVDDWAMENEVGMNCRLTYCVVNNEPFIERCEFNDSRTEIPMWVQFVLPTPFRVQLLKFARKHIAQLGMSRDEKQFDDDIEWLETLNGRTAA